MRLAPLGLVLALAATLVTACAPLHGAGAVPPGGTIGTTTDAGSSVATELSGEVVVLAAASLREAFTELGDAFESRHPGVSVTFGFGGSSGLAAQLVSGAPADVFAAASTSTMATVVEGLRPGSDATAPAVFARTAMVLAVPRANRAGVRSIADLEDVSFAVCAPEVPCGAVAARVLEAAGVDAVPVTYEKDVTAVLVKVREDEVDAGFVYATDVDESVLAIELPGPLDATTTYPILTLPEAPNPAGAAAFTDFVLSPAGRAVMAGHGFAAP